MAKWFTALKVHRHIRAGEYLIHSEGIRRPIGFNDSRQRRDSILRRIHRALNHEIETLLSAKHAGNVKGQNTTAKVTNGRRLGGGVRRDCDAVQSCAAAPAGGEGGGAQQLPAVRTSDI
jgi:hypothetical protein